MNGPSASRVAALARQAKLRSLSGWELEAVREHLRSHKGQRNPGTGLKFGQPYDYDGKQWFVYDFQANQDIPGGISLVLISTTLDAILDEDVDPTAGKPRAYKPLPNAPQGLFVGQQVIFTHKVKTRWELSVPSGTEGTVKSVRPQHVMIEPIDAPGWKPGESMFWASEADALKDVQPA